MPYAWIQDVPIGEEEYRQIIAGLGAEPLEGNLLHLAFRTSGGTLRYVDVWASEALCDRAFEERIHPVVHPVLERRGDGPTEEPPRQQVELIDARGSLLQGAVTGAAAWGGAQ